MRSILEIAETALAVAQGKGYGSSTVEREVKAAASFLRSEGRLIVDVGGNRGDYSAVLRSTFPLAELHIFEPSTTNIAILSRRFEGDERTIVQPYALGNVASQATLHADRIGSGLASLTKRRLDHFGLTFDHAEPVTVMRFEDYWHTALSDRAIDLLKIDVEGHELDVLNGMGEALAKTRVLQFEFGGCNIDTRTYFQDFWYFFKERGFDLYRIGPFAVHKLSHYRETHEHFRTTNYLAITR